MSALLFYFLPLNLLEFVTYRYLYQALHRSFSQTFWKMFIISGLILLETQVLYVGHTKANPLLLHRILHQKIQFI
jgi:hypothetical protein